MKFFCCFRKKRENIDDSAAAAADAADVKCKNIKTFNVFVTDDDRLSELTCITKNDSIFYKEDDDDIVSK